MKDVHGFGGARCWPAKGSIVFAALSCTESAGIIDCEVYNAVSCFVVVQCRGAQSCLVVGRVKLSPDFL